MPLTPVPIKRGDWKGGVFGRASELRNSKVVRETVKLAEAISKRGGFKAIKDSKGRNGLWALNKALQRKQP